MTTTTLTSKGQITVPAAIRSALGVGTGDRVEFVEVAPGRYEFIAATRPVTALKGMFGKPGKPVSIEAMNAAIVRRGASAKDASR
jgi:AbrB family looped-hinge helix DNA binding protein